MKRGKASDEAIAAMVHAGATNASIAGDLAVGSSRISKVRKAIKEGVVFELPGPVEDDDDDEGEGAAAEPDDDGMTLVNTEYLRTLEVVRDLVEENLRLRAREVANG